MPSKLSLSLVAAALVCLAGWTGYGQGQRSSPGRSGWEYKSMAFQIQGAKTALHEDGKQIAAGPAADPLRKANELGGQEWELVSVAVSDSEYVTTFVYMFKRPK